MCLQENSTIQKKCTKKNSIKTKKLKHGVRSVRFTSALENALKAITQEQIINIRG